MVGVFHPVLNWCGGAEWVAINVINTLRRHGHKVSILINESLDQTKIVKIHGRNLEVDAQIVFPLAFFPPTDYHNIYTDALRSLILKGKCGIVVDTFSNTILPRTDIVYIHFPLLRRVPPTFRNKVFYYPHREYMRRIEDLDQTLILANSEYTASAIKESMGLDAHILYPPLLASFLNNKAFLNITRGNIAVTVARISEGKNLELIPDVAKLTDRTVSFLLIGLLDSASTLGSIVKLIRKFDLSERVKILTNVPRDHLRTVLLNSKVYFHTAIGEHFGVSIAEAMASGCIPIVHDSGGPREFVPDSFRYKSAEEAAMKIEKAMSDWSPNQAGRMLGIARKFHEDEFSERFIELFDLHVET